MKKKSLPRKSGTQPLGGGSEAHPWSGVADPGKSFDAMGMPDDYEESPGQPRSAPAPGVPVSAEELKLLKEKANYIRRPPAEHVQEDPAEKK